MYKSMRLAVIAFYLLAALGSVVELPFAAGPWLLKIALLMLAAHVLEALLVRKKLKLYDGPLYISVLLTLVFGFLHWGPLKRRNNVEADDK